MEKVAGRSATIAEQLAQWIVSLERKRLPEAVVGQIRALVMDAAGLCIAARNSDYIEAALAAFPGDGPCSVLGSPRGAEPAAAALINGIAVHGEDFDDTFEEGIVHLGAVVVPAVLAVCEQYRLSGERALIGIAAGAEVLGRLSLVAPTAIHRAGFHPTAILGPFGAVAGVGAALALTAAEIADAFGVAGSMAAGIIEYLADGTWTKRMHPGWAAQSGIRAALLGKCGFRGPRTVFEGRHGLFNGFAPDAEPSFSRLVDDLGERWKLQRIAFKPYACGTICHPYIDCAVDLSNQGVQAADIVEIVCEVGEGSVHRLWEPASEKRRPSTPYSAKFSVPYCIAVGFMQGAAGLVEFADERITDPRVLELAAKVRYIVDPANEYPRNFTGHLKAKLVDGSVREIRRPHLRGGSRAPLSMADLEAKFNANTAFGGWDGERSERLRHFCLNFDSAVDLSVLEQFRG